MTKMRVTFLGSGDAFGSGGRLQPCLWVESPACNFLIDCGATVMPAMRRYQVKPDAVDVILISHLHGDHFGGIPFFILDGQLISKRTKPLVIAGPAGTAKKLNLLMETMFPGSATVQRKFPVEILELTPSVRQALPGLQVTPYRVEHMVSDDALALRIECCDQIIAYTGDTEWTDALMPACSAANLVIAEAYYYEKKVKYHMDLQTLLKHWPEMQAERLVLTHMSSEMLLHLGELKGEFADDGKVIELGRLEATQ